MEHALYIFKPLYLYQCCNKLSLRVSRYQFNTALCLSKSLLYSNFLMTLFALCFKDLSISLLSSGLWQFTQKSMLRCVMNLLGHREGTIDKTRKRMLPASYSQITPINAIQQSLTCLIEVGGMNKKFLC